MLLSRIKGLIIVFMSSNEYNTDFIYRKKTSQLNFSPRFQIYILMVSKLLGILFTRSNNFSLIKEIFNKKHWSWKFFTKNLIKEIFHKNVDQRNFPQLRTFSTKILIKDIFHSQRNFQQGSFLQKNWSTNFFIVKKIFHKKPKIKIHVMLNLMQKYF